MQFELGRYPSSLWLTRKDTCPTVTGSSGWLGEPFRDHGFPIKYGDGKIT
jgi:hypothetical protein